MHGVSQPTHAFLSNRVPLVPKARALALSHHSLFLLSLPLTIYLLFPCLSFSLKGTPSPHLLPCVSISISSPFHSVLTLKPVSREAEERATLGPRQRKWRNLRERKTLFSLSVWTFIHCEVTLSLYRGLTICQCRELFSLFSLVEAEGEA